MALLLAIPYTLLFLFGSVQLGLISDMVGFLHIQKTEVQTYEIFESNTHSAAFILHALPANIILNHGHTSNGAAGYGLVVGLAGLVGVCFLSRVNSHLRYTLLLIMTTLLTLSTLLTLAAFIYTFVVTYQTWNQTISIPLAVALFQSSPSSPPPYPVDSWTPETWYRAVLRLPIAESYLAHTLRFHDHEMTAWRWWLLPYLLVDAFALGCTVVHTLRQRRILRLDRRDDAVMTKEEEGEVKREDVKRDGEQI